MTLTEFTHKFPWIYPGNTDKLGIVAKDLYRVPVQVAVIFPDDRVLFYTNKGDELVYTHKDIIEGVFEQYHYFKKDLDKITDAVL